MSIDSRAGRIAIWGVLFPAAAIMMLTMGIRQVSGLFVSPINTATGLGIVSISFALAVGQFVWGAAQPIFGAAADRFGPVPIIVAGGLLLALGTAITPFMTSEWGLVLSMGIMVAAGAGAGSFSILIAAAARGLPPERRSFGAGVVNAGGSFGQFVFAPITERLIALAGWVNAMFALAVLMLATLPLAAMLKRGSASASASASAAAQASALAQASASASAQASSASPTSTPAASSAPPVPPAIGMRQQLAVAMRDRSYLLLHAGFFTCGFHIAFLVTHLPGEIALCGLPTSVSGISIALIGLANIAGSLAAGALGSRYRMKYLLFWMYLSRAVLILIYMAAPKEPITFYLFAVALGLTWLATVPPTAGIVGKLFGVRYLATLFGLTLLSHQVGGFLGAWLGGIAFDRTGSYDWMWIADAVLATIAALVNLPIREERLRPAAAAARAA